MEGAEVIWWRQDSCRSVWGCIRIQDGELWRRSVSACLPVWHTEAGDAPEIGLPFSIPRSHLNTPRVTHSDWPPTPLVAPSPTPRWEFRVKSWRLWQKYTRPSKCYICSDVSILPFVGSLSNRRSKSTQKHLSVCVRSLHSGQPNNYLYPMF